MYLVWRFPSVFCRYIFITVYNIMDATSLSDCALLVLPRRLYVCLPWATLFCAETFYDCVWLAGLAQALCCKRVLNSLCCARPWLRSWHSLSRCGGARTSVVEFYCICCLSRGLRMIPKLLIRRTIWKRSSYQPRKTVSRILGGRSRTCIVHGLRTCWCHL